MKLVRLNFTVIVMFCFVVSARAENSKSYLLYVGMAAPQTKETTTNELVGSVGLAVNGQYLKRISEKVQVGLDYNYCPFGVNEFALSNANWEFKSTALALSGLVKITPVPENNIRGLFYAGLGLNYFTAKAEGRPVPGYVWSDTSTTEKRIIVADDSFGLAVFVGTEVQVDLTPEWLVAITGRYNLLGVDIEDLDKSFVSSLQFSFGVGKRF